MKRFVVYLKFSTPIAVISSKERRTPHDARNTCFPPTPTVFLGRIRKKISQKPLLVNQPSAASPFGAFVFELATLRTVSRRGPLWFCENKRVRVFIIINGVTFDQGHGRRRSNDDARATAIINNAFVAVPSRRGAGSRE